MTFEEWYEKYDRDTDVLNAIHYLQKMKPYTDDEIIEAIEKIKEVSFYCGLSLGEIVRILVVNETWELKS